MNGLEEMALRIAGMPQDTIDKLDAATPGAAALVKLVKDNDPLIREIIALAKKAQPLLAQAAPLLIAAAPLYIEAQPLIAKAMPLIDQAKADVDEILPAAIAVLAFIQTPQAGSDS